MGKKIQIGEYSVELKLDKGDFLKAAKQADAASQQLTDDVSKLGDTIEQVSSRVSSSAKEMSDSVSGTQKSVGKIATLLNKSGTATNGFASVTEQMQAMVKQGQKAQDVIKGVYTAMHGSGSRNNELGKFFVDADQAVQNIRNVGIAQYNGAKKKGQTSTMKNMATYAAKWGNSLTARGQDLEKLLGADFPVFQEMVEGADQAKMATYSVKEFIDALDNLKKAASAGVDLSILIDSKDILKEVGNTTNNVTKEIVENNRQISASAEQMAQQVVESQKKVADATSQNSSKSKGKRIRTVSLKNFTDEQKNALDERQKFLQELFKEYHEIGQLRALDRHGRYDSADFQEDVFDDITKMYQEYRGITKKLDRKGIDEINPQFTLFKQLGLNQQTNGEQIDEWYRNAFSNQEKFKKYYEKIQQNDVTIMARVDAMKFDAILDSQNDDKYANDLFEKGNANLDKVKQMKADTGAINRNNVTRYTEVQSQKLIGTDQELNKQFQEYYNQYIRMRQEIRDKKIDQDELYKEWVERLNDSNPDKGTPKAGRNKQTAQLVAYFDQLMDNTQYNDESTLFSQYDPTLSDHKYAEIEYGHSIIERAKAYRNLRKAYAGLQIDKASKHSGQIDAMGQQMESIIKEISGLDSQFDNLKLTDDTDKIDQIGQLIQKYDKAHQRVAELSEKYSKNSQEIKYSRYGRKFQLLNGFIDDTSNAKQALSSRKNQLQELKATEEAAGATQDQANASAQAASNANDTASAQQDVASAASQTADAEQQVATASAQASENARDIATAQQNAADAASDSAMATNNVADAQGEVTQAVRQAADAQEQAANASRQNAQNAQAAADASKEQAKNAQVAADAQAGQKPKEKTPVEKAQDAINAYAKGSNLAEIKMLPEDTFTQVAQKLSATVDAFNSFSEFAGRLKAKLSDEEFKQLNFGEFSGIAGEINRLTDLGKAIRPESFGQGSNWWGDKEKESAANWVRTQLKEFLGQTWDVVVGSNFATYDENGKQNGMTVPGVTLKRRTTREGQTYTDRTIRLNPGIEGGIEGLEAMISQMKKGTLAVSDFYNWLNYAGSQNTSTRPTSGEKYSKEEADRIASVIQENIKRISDEFTSDTFSVKISQKDKSARIFRGAVDAQNGVAYKQSFSVKDAAEFAKVLSDQTKTKEQIQDYIRKAYEADKSAYTSRESRAFGEDKSGSSNSSRLDQITQEEAALRDLINLEGEYQKLLAKEKAGVITGVESDRLESLSFYRQNLLELVKKSDKKWQEDIEKTGRKYPQATDFQNDSITGRLATNYMRERAKYVNEQTNTTKRFAGYMNLTQNERGVASSAIDWLNQFKQANNIPQFAADIETAENKVASLIDQMAAGKKTASDFVEQFSKTQAKLSSISGYIGENASTDTGMRFMQRAILDKAQTTPENEAGYKLISSKTNANGITRITAQVKDSNNVVQTWAAQWNQATGKISSYLMDVEKESTVVKELTDAYSVLAKARSNKISGKAGAENEQQAALQAVSDANEKINERVKAGLMSQDRAKEIRSQARSQYDADAVINYQKAVQKLIKTQREAQELQNAYNNGTAQSKDIVKLNQLIEQRKAANEEIERGIKLQAVQTDSKSIQLANQYLQTQQNVTKEIQARNEKSMYGDESEAQKALRRLKDSQKEYQQLQARSDSGVATERQLNRLKELIAEREKYIATLKESSEAFKNADRETPSANDFAKGPERNAAAQYNRKRNAEADKATVYYDLDEQARNAINKVKNQINTFAQRGAQKGFLDGDSVQAFNEQLDAAYTKLQKLRDQLANGKITLKDFREQAEKSIVSQLDSIQKFTDVSTLGNGNDRAKLLQQTIKNVSGLTGEALNSDITFGDMSTTTDGVNKLTATVVQSDGVIQKYVATLNSVTGALQLFDAGTISPEKQVVLLTKAFQDLHNAQMGIMKGNEGAETAEKDAQQRINTLSKALRNSGNEPLVGVAREESGYDAAKIDKVRQAYETLISTESRYQILMSKRSNGNLYGKQIQQLDQLVKARAQAARQLQNTQSGMDKHPEYQSQIDNLKQASEEVQKQTADLVNRGTQASKEFKTAIDNMNLGADMQDFANEAKTNIDKVTQAFEEGKQGPLEYQQSLDKIVNSLKNTIKRVDVNSQAFKKNAADAADQEMLAVAKQMAGGNKIRSDYKSSTILASDGKEIRQMNVAWEDQAHNIHEVILQLDMLNGALSKTGEQFQAVKSPADKFKDSFVDGFKRIGAQLAMFTSFQDFIRYGKQMLETVKEFDDAFTEMRKVSEESAASLHNFQKQSFGIADGLGTTALQIQQSTAEFMRLGESLSQAQESAKNANLLLNVSEFDSIEDATTSLIAMTSAFQDAEQVDIIDKLNKVGKNNCLNLW